MREERNLLQESSEYIDDLKNQMTTELRRLGFCPLDVEEPFIIPYGPDKGKEVTCQYFKEDNTRCSSMHIGEVNCNSVCGRNKNLCKLYPKSTSSQCQDDRSFEFVQDNGATANCYWLSKRAQRKEKYCGRTEISNGCMATCEKCFKNVQNTSAPSQSPTSCSNKKQFRFPTSTGEKSCKWLCRHKKANKVKRRQARYCKGDVSISCCEACNAGPRCRQ